MPGQARSAPDSARLEALDAGVPHIDKNFQVVLGSGHASSVMECGLSARTVLRALRVS